MSIKTLTLDNGLRIAFQSAETKTNLASIQVFCDVGSVHETEGNRGSAHFIEHMCFKGTKKLPTSRDVNLVFDITGSESNAYTDRRHTCYYVSTHKDNTDKCIQVIGDMLLNSTFVKSEYMKERDVVKEEAIKDEDDAELLAFVETDAIIYRGTPYQHSVDELKYHVGKNVLQYDAVIDMYKKYYVPNRIILSICSNNKFEDIVKWAAKAFLSKSVHHFEPLNLGLIQPLHTMPTIVIKKRNISPIIVCIGFRTCSLYHPDKYPLKLLKAVLSGRMTSRMFMLLREENGLTYSSYASCDFFEHMGDFKLFAECNPDKFLKNGSKDGVFPLLMHMINNLVISEKEMIDAKQYIEGNYKMKCENPDIIAKHNGKSILMGIKPIEYKYKYKTYYAPITVDQVNECVKKYFNVNNLVVTIVGSNPPSQKKLSEYIS